jgi:hypothetical protein
MFTAMLLLVSAVVIAVTIYDDAGEAARDRPAQADRQPQRAHHRR